jgi:hypothetical protein
MEQNQLYLIKSGQNSFVETEGEVKIGLSGGNIGFGTTEPEAFMHVTGNTQIDGDLTVKGDFTTVNSSTIQVDDKNIEIGVGATTDAAADGGGITLHGATNKTINWSNANDAWTSSEHLRTADGKHVASDEIRALDGDGLKLYDDGGNGIFVEDGGNVGVGTTNPTVTLDVTGAASFGASVSAGSSIDATTTMSAGTSLTTPIVKAADVNGLNLQDDDGNGIFVEDGGNVGVGTTDPSATLDVVGSGNFSAGLYVDGNAVVTGDAGKWEDGAEANEIYYDAGNVGVGTSNPSATLDVVGSGNFSAGLYVNGNAVATGAGGKWEDGAEANEIYYDAGNVGVGTSNPSVALDVVGAGAYSTNLTVGGTVDTTNLTFDQINSAAGSNNNDVIAYNGSSWTVKAASQLGLGGGSTSSQAPDSFETSVPNGASQVAIQFSETYDNVPQIAATVEVNGEGEIIPHTVSGVSTTGYHVVFSEAVPNANYSVHTLFGAKDVYWETGASDLQYSTNDVKIGQNLTVSGSFYGDQVRANSSAGLKLYDDAGNGMFIKDGGNVGIGTTNPSSFTGFMGTSALTTTIASSSGAVLNLQRGTDINNAGIGALQFVNTNNSSGTGMGSGSQSLGLISIQNVTSDSNAASDAGGNMRLYTKEEAGSCKERMRITSAGNVGIGTTNPNQGNLMLYADDVVAQVFACGGTDLDYRNWAINAGGTTKGALHFQVGDSVGDNPISSSKTKVTFDKEGNVGIGTTNPGYKLDVQDSVASWSARVVNSNTSGNGLVVSISSTSSSARIFSANSASVARFYVRADGTSYTGGSVVTSDDRVKHNEQPIVGALETLSKITPKKYIKTAEMYEANHDFELDADGNPIDENGEPVEHRIETGVIAQQVLTVDELAFAVSPEGVDEDGTVTSPHGLDYNSLFTYAIAAIQEQQQLIDDLKSRIETLEQ